MQNLTSKFNNYFILTTFLLAVVAFQFGFLNSSNFLFLSSINLFFILSILICVSTKNLSRIILPIFVISIASSLYSNVNILIHISVYIIFAVIVFYLHKNFLFITDYYRFLLLIIVATIIFKVLFYLEIFVFNYFYHQQIVLPIFDLHFFIKILFEIVCSIVILSIFKPDIKFINYEFLVGN